MKILTTFALFLLPYLILNGEELFMEVNNPDGPDIIDAIEVNENDDIVIAGIISGDVQLGNTSDDIISTPESESPFIAMLNQSGELIWSRVFPVEGRGVFLDLETTNSAIFVSFEFEESVEINDSLYENSEFMGSATLKMTNEGDYLWKEVFNHERSGKISILSSDDKGNMLAVFHHTGGDDIYINGETFTVPEYESLLALFNENMVVEWTVPLNIQMSGGAIFNNGNIYVSGVWEQNPGFIDNYNFQKGHDAGIPIIFSIKNDGEVRWVNSPDFIPGPDDDPEIPTMPVYETMLLSEDEESIFLSASFYDTLKWDNHTIYTDFTDHINKEHFLLEMNLAEGVVEWIEKFETSNRFAKNDGLMPLQEKNHKLWIAGSVSPSLLYKNETLATSIGDGTSDGVLLELDESRSFEKIIFSMEASGSEIAAVSINDFSYDNSGRIILGGGVQLGQGIIGEHTIEAEIAGGYIWRPDNLAIPISIQEHVNELELYPIPANDNINIELNQQNTGMSKVTFFNLQGHKVLRKPLTKKHNKLDISTLRHGVYLLEISDKKNNQKFYERIIVE